MKQYRNAQEVHAELGTQSSGGMHQFPEGNAARMSSLGLGASLPSTAPVGGEEETKAPNAEERPASQGPGSEEGPSEERPSGEVEAMHGSHDHDDLGGSDLVEIGPHLLSTGTINMLVDYVESLEELEEMKASDLDEGLVLIERMEAHEATASDQERFAEIFPKYKKIALGNSDHFAPPSNGVAPAGSQNYLGQMREHLGKAHELATDGDLNGALVNASWGGHYIADAFSAGHLVNKDEIMFNADVHLQAYGYAKVFAEAARGVMAEGNQAKGWQVQRDAGREALKAGDLKSLFTVTDVVRHVAITGAIAKAVHDELSAGETGPLVEVTAGGLTWDMGGDGTLDDTSKEVCSGLIAGVYEELRAQAEDPEHISAAGLLAWAESCLPQPTASGQKRIDDVVAGIFDSPESLGQALADASLAEFDSVMANFEAMPMVCKAVLNGTLVRVDDTEEGEHAHAHASGGDEKTRSEAAGDAT